MTQPANDSYDNVFPLRRIHQPYAEPHPVSIDDLAQATASFHQLERCIAGLKLGWTLSGGIDSSIVSFQVHLPKAKRWLGLLEHITIATWPDPRWARSLGGARATAARSLRTAVRSLYRRPPGAAPIGEPLATDVEDLARALAALRTLITDRYPEAAPLP